MKAKYVNEDLRDLINNLDPEGPNDPRITGFDRIDKLINELKKLKYSGGNETADVGNDIGQVIYKYFTEDDNLENFIWGLKHGISVVSGTHDLDNKENYN